MSILYIYIQIFSVEVNSMRYVLSLVSSFSTAVLSSALCSVLFSMDVIAQDDDKKAAQQQCEKVMAYMAVETGQSYGETPCLTNTYSKALWICVEDRVADGSAFHLSVQRCESRMGLN